LTKEDADISFKIFGPSVTKGKGNTTRQAAKLSPSSIVSIPKEVIRAQQQVVLCIDFFCLNGKHIFFTTYSEKICFTTNSHIVNRKVMSYWPMLKAVCLMYEARGLHEFLPLQELVNELPTRLEPEFVAQGMHVGPVERNIRYEKEKTRSLRYTLPFDKISKAMLVHVTIVMNMFPRKGGHAIYSPQMIMTGRSVTINDLSIPFGS
jgi:hypothetical protein